MQQTKKPVSKFKVFLMWFLLIGNLVFWIAFWTWRHGSNPSAPPDAETGSGIFRAIFLVVIGGFFLAAGTGSYLIIVATTCLTFDFSNPVFSAYKGKQYLAKIVVPTLIGLGVGSMLAVVLEPVLRSFGVTGEL